MKKAEVDHRAAVLLAASSDPVNEAVCFHCQQCAEKYLKGLMVELGLPITKTHDLQALLRALLSHHSTLRTLRRGLVFLTDFAVDTRYPGKRVSKRQAMSALRWADRTRSAARTLLGM